MPISEFDALQHEKVLYLTTVGRNTGAARTIEIWFVSYQGRIYLLAEHGLKAHWVRNIQANPDVIIQIGEHRFHARGRLLDDARDRREWQAVADVSRRKYGWGDGWPVAFDIRRGWGQGGELGVHRNGEAHRPEPDGWRRTSLLRVKMAWRDTAEQTP